MQQSLTNIITLHIRKCEAQGQKHGDGLTVTSSLLTQTPLWWIYMCIQSSLGVNGSLCLLTNKQTFTENQLVSFFVCLFMSHFHFHSFALWQINDADWFVPYLPFGGHIIISSPYLFSLSNTAFLLCPTCLYLLLQSASWLLFPIVCLTTMEEIVPQAVWML